jgi:hypothetical protein
MNRIFAHFDNYQPVYMIAAAVVCLFVGIVGIALAHNIIAHPWLVL